MEVSNLSFKSVLSNNESILFKDDYLLSLLNTEEIADKVEIKNENQGNYLFQNIGYQQNNVNIHKSEHESITKVSSSVNNLYSNANYLGMDPFKNNLIEKIEANDDSCLNQLDLSKTSGIETKNHLNSNNKLIFDSSNSNSHIINMNFPFYPCYYPINLPNYLYSPNFYLNQINPQIYNIKYTSFNHPLDIKQESKKSNKKEKSIKLEKNNNSNEEYLFLYDLYKSKRFISYLFSENGCKDIQRRFSNMNIETKEYLLELVIKFNILIQMMKDSLANYLFQKIYHISDINKRCIIIKLITNHILELGNTTFGSHSIQGMIKISQKHCTEIEKLMEVIFPYIKELCFNQLGHHIILKLLINVREFKREKVNILLVSFLNELLINPFGVSVVSDINITLLILIRLKLFSKRRNQSKEILFA